MSTDDILRGIQSVTTSIGTGVNTVTRAAADLGVGLPKVSFIENLKPARFAGVDFAVLEAESQFGRRNVLHEYPNRDQSWVEDLGRSSRVINVTGFICGDDIVTRRDRMIAAAEAPGDSRELNHPTYGLLTVNLLGPLVFREVWDKGRVFELRFSCVEAGAKVFPAATPATAKVVANAASDTRAAAATDFAAQVGPALKKGAVVVQQAANTAAAWGRRVQNLSNDATNLQNSVASLTGELGRFAGGRTKGGLAVAAAGLASSSTVTVQSLIGAAAHARTVVSAAVSALSSAASNLGNS
jgi:prophage DNA circulation protein